MTLPGLDGMLDTGDDQPDPLDGLHARDHDSRRAGESGSCARSTVTVTYQSGTRQRTYTLTTFISAYS